MGVREDAGAGGRASSPAGRGMPRPYGPPVYPLAEHASGQVVTAGGRPVAEITLERVLAGEVGAGDLRIAPETLQLQADFAAAGGNPQLAENLRRGAELCAFEDAELLDFYEKLRPGRSTAAELEQLSSALETRGASGCAALVREARDAYARRGLIS